MPLNPTVPAYGKTITGANCAIGCTTPTAATQTLTLSGNAVAGETFTIGGLTYTWTSTAANYTGQTPFFVKIGVDAATSIVNATAAINGTASKGTLFSNNTNPNPYVTAAATSSTILTITATAPGADGNGIPLSETMTNAVWGSTVTAGGVSASLNVDIAASGATQNVNLTQVNGSTIALGSAAAAASLPVVQPTVSQAPACTAAVASGSTTAGATNITFLADSSFVGTLLGQTFAAGASLTFRASENNTVGAIAYTRSAGTLYIYTLT